MLLFSILGGTAVLATASIVGLVFWMLGNGEKTARHASSQFAAALVAADPQRAPEGAREYVSGVPAHFGKVSAAEVIDARNEKRTAHPQHRRRRQQRQAPQVQAAPHVQEHHHLLRRRRAGPHRARAGGARARVHPLAHERLGDRQRRARARAAEIRDGLLDDDLRAEHAAAFKARGGVAATHFELIGASARIAAITKPKPRATPQSAAADPAALHPGRARRRDEDDALRRAELTGREQPQRGHRRLEEVVAAAQRDEARLRLQEERRVALDRHLALRPVRLADQEVLVAAEAERVAVVDPERLDRLELAPDVGLEADEDQPAVDAVVLGRARRQRRAVGAAAADDPVAVGQPPVEEAGRVARVGAADVGAERALRSPSASSA